MVNCASECNICVVVGEGEMVWLIEVVGEDAFLY